MPKERINASGNNSFADVMVRWSKLGSAEQVEAQGSERTHVDLFVIASDLPGRGGYYMFTPEFPETYDLEPGASIGPISIDLYRTQINRLIRVLRTARDAAYGSDE